MLNSAGSGGNPVKKLNIAIVCDPIDYVAGVTVSATRLSERLIAKGHKIVFIAAKFPKSLSAGYRGKAKVYRFRSLLLPKTEKSFYIALPTFSEVKKALQEENIDILHIFLPTPAAFVFMKAARATGVKIVTHSHSQPENVFLHVPKILGRNIMSKIYGKYLSYIYERSDALIYPSEFAETLFPELNSKIKHTVISNGVDMSVFKKVDAKKFRDKHDISPTAPVILFVGRLHPEKSVDTLIRAFPKILKEQPNARLLIVGDGHQAEELRQLSKNLNVGETVMFLGKISGEDLVSAYNACDIFILPSLAELEGMVVLEAMACGKPIVIADSPSSASRYFVDGNGFLFRPEDPEDLARQALKLLLSKHAREAMGKKSLENSKRYDINQSVSRLEELYYSLLSGQT